MSLLTIGLPIYKSMPYLPETMESLWSQTEEDFEILAIVDDCSDGSVEYMESLRDPRLRIIRQAKAGLVPTLNRMLREIDTPWLVRQDADDIAYPNRIERILRAVKEEPEAGMFYSLAEYYPHGKAVGQFRTTLGTPEELRKTVQDGYLLTFCHPSVVLNRDVALSIGGYRQQSTGEDADMWWRMALESDIHLIPEVLLGYRHHGNQATTTEMRLNLVHGLYIQYLLLSHIWGLQPRPEEEIRPILESLVPDGYINAKNLLRKFNIEMSKRNFFSAATSFAKSFLSSPEYLVQRTIDEFFPKKRIANGVDPKIFLRRKKEFWPNASDALGRGIQEPV